MSHIIDSFGTFLETVNNPTTTPAIGSPFSLDILHFVQQHGGEASTLDILQGVKMPLASIASSLESLKDTHLIEVRTGGPTESVSLTDMGNVVANLSLDMRNKAGQI